MIIRNFKPFVGEHCETTATGCLLKQMGIELSEPMLFGLGEGLGYIFWKMKTMDFPFIGGRIKTDLLIENICKNLNLKLKIKETSSRKKAWTNIEEVIEKGKAVGLKLDCYHLDYFTTKIHFAGHYVAMYGHDDDFAYLVDTNQQGGQVKTSLENLALARNERGPMSSRNRSFTIEQVEELPNLKDVVKNAIRNNANQYLNPPISNFNFKGIAKTASAIEVWFNNSSTKQHDFQTTAMLMERAGTGGALFRNLYRDFLKESCYVLENSTIEKAYLEFEEIAQLWTHVSELFFLVGESQDIKHINEASLILLDLSEKERKVMDGLLLAFQ